MCGCPPGIVKVMMNYKSCKCIIEAFCGGDGFNLLSLQDFSAVLRRICSVKTTDPCPAAVQGWAGSQGVLAVGRKFMEPCEGV